MVMTSSLTLGLIGASAASRLRFTSGVRRCPILGTLFKRVMINVAWAFALIIVMALFQAPFKYAAVASEWSRDRPFGYALSTGMAGPLRR
jgi:hypothetical protein